MRLHEREGHGLEVKGSGAQIVWFFYTHGIIFVLWLGNNIGAPASEDQSSTAMSFVVPVGEGES